MNNTLKLIPLGGMGTITKNMYLYQVGKQILIVDCGLGFPDESTPGVDILIPDVTYLEDKKDWIVGMVLTHGHDDHIGGLPYILPQIGTNFPIYGSKLTVGFAKDRLKETDIKASFKTFDTNEVTIGPFKVRPIDMTHSVPDAKHLAIHTPAGIIYHGTDFKFDLNPINGVQPDFQAINEVGQEGVLALLSDSLNSEDQEFSESESTLRGMFEREMRHVEGKIIITVMSSNIHRIQQAVDVAQEVGRKVAFIGWSIERNVETATKLGYLHLPKKAAVNKYKTKKLPPEKICYIVAGSQGQVESSLVRAAAGTHSLVKMNPQDKIIFASDAIPGNEANVYKTIDMISKSGAKVHYADIDASVHVSGHSSAIEQKLLMSFVKAKHVIPIGGAFHHMIQYQNLAYSMGYQDDQIHLMENGDVIEFSKNNVSVNQMLDLKQVVVEGNQWFEDNDRVLEDRSQLATAGNVTIMFSKEKMADLSADDLKIITRGFIPWGEGDIIYLIKQIAAGIISSSSVTQKDWAKERQHLEEDVEKEINTELKRRPVVTLIAT